MMKNLFRNICFLTFLFFITYSPIKTNAQTAGDTKKVLTGTITDKVTGEPIPGASVWVKETTVGTSSDGAGKFSLSVTGKGGVLAVYFVGYTQEEIAIGSETVINFQLSTDVESLEGAVVVAYGTQRKASVIGAISTVAVDNLKLASGPISNALAGQMAGVVSVTRSGEPGTGSEFYIRGISTFGSNKNPLVLVDGIERSIDLVDPEDIASFSVLKDATATAVYGVRGANGVILINTRKGFEGKPRITVRVEAGMLSPVKMPKMVNSLQFAEMYNEAEGKEFYSATDLQLYKDGTDPDLHPNSRWIKELYKDNAFNQRVNVNIAGGGSIARYYVAGSLYNESSIFKNDKSNDYNSSINYNKINFRANLDLNLSESTVLNINLSNIYEKKNEPGAKKSDIWGYSFSTSPNAFPMRFSDGKFAGPTSGANPYNLLMQSGYREEFWNSAQSLVGLTQDFSDIITPGLKANIKFSWDAINQNRIIRLKSPETYIANGRDGNGNILYNQTNKGTESLGFDSKNAGEKVNYLEASINYDRTFNDVHRLGALFLYNQKQKNITALYEVDDVKFTSLGSLPYKNQGIAGRIAYSYDDRYFAEVNAGYNGSENFSPGHRFGFFPAAAVGWIISNEKFFKSLEKTINLLKLKVSHGVVGNDQIGGGRRFIYEATIATGGGAYPLGETGGHNPGYVRIGDWPNTNVGWEEAYKTNVGLEISFFDALNLQVDYFYEKREGIFMQRAALPNMVGLNNVPWVNVGKMKNQGVDASFDFMKKIGEVYVTARGTFTYNQNEVVDNDEPDWNYKYRNKIGKPHGQQWGLDALGYFNSQEEINSSPAQFGALRVGDIKYRDINGDGVINESDVIAIGNSNIPQINYGFGATAAWKGFDVSVFFQGISRVSFQMSGSSIYAFSAANILRAGINEDVYDHRWREGEDNSGAKYPRLYNGNNTNNNRASTQFLASGSFLRLKNAEIGYTLPTSVTDKLKLNSVRFYVSGLNLLTFSKFKLWDPEGVSADGSKYPSNRVINVGVNFNF